MYAFTFEFNPFRDLSTIHFYAVVIILIVTWIARELKERAGQSWPVVYGTVEFAELVTVDGRMRAEVRYSYSVNNEYFSGVFFRFPRSEKKGEALLAAIPKDSRVLVHYKPDAPEISVLDRNEIKAKLQQSHGAHFGRLSSFE
ncbi:MAG TPA: hypothetical protein VN673_08875 [Clostridia bacterium]|nr:hypothetical protein [Clostridia bacterium]